MYAYIYLLARSRHVLPLFTFGTNLLRKKSTNVLTEKKNSLFINYLTYTSIR